MGVRQLQPRGRSHRPAAAPRARALCIATFGYVGPSITRQSDLFELGADFGSLVQEISYSGNIATVFTGDRMSTTVPATRAHFRHFKRDTRGFDARVLLWSAPGAPIANLEGAYGDAFGYDDAGRLTRRVALDDTGQETGPVTRIRYRDDGLVSEIRIESGDGTLRLGPDGFAIARPDYDSDGNPAGATYLDAAEQPFTPAVTPLLARYAG